MASAGSVLHITEAFSGGVLTHLGHVLPVQVARGLEVTLVCSPHARPDSGPAIALLRSRGVTVQAVRMAKTLRPAMDALAFRSILRLLARQRFDVMHTHGFKAGVLGRIAARRVGGVATVHTPHCFPFLRCGSTLARWFTLGVERRLARVTDCLMVVSSSQWRAACVHGIHSERWKVVPNGVPEPTLTPSTEIESLRRELSIASGQRVIGTCCRLVPYKGVDQFVRAAHVLLSRQPGLVFLVVGDGPSRRAIARRVRRLGLENAVRMLGYRGDVPALLELMDVFVLCSLAEGMPYVLLEAMSRGTPVVASNVHGNHDVLAHGQTGLLYEYADVDDLVRNVELLLRDHRLRDDVVTAARRQVRTAHRLEDQVDSIMASYVEVGGRAGPTGERAERVPTAAKPLRAIGR